MGVIPHRRGSRGRGNDPFRCGGATGTHGKTRKVGCICPEGADVNAIGQMLPFRRGMAPNHQRGVMIPIFRGIWPRLGARFFSFAAGRFFGNFRGKFPDPVRVTFERRCPREGTGPRDVGVACGAGFGCRSLLACARSGMHFAHSFIYSSAQGKPSVCDGRWQRGPETDAGF